MLPSYTRLTAATALLLAGAAQAGTPLHIVLSNQECGLVMFDVYGDYNWPGVGEGDYYGALCQNPNAVVSIYASLYTYCRPMRSNPASTL